MTTTRAFVLVVDDLPDAADSLGDLLTLWGYDAAACYCGESALTAAISRPPAAVVLDLGMVPMDGFEFAVRFRRLPGNGGTPLVAVTGHTSEGYRDRARAAGIGHYLVKPAEPAFVQKLMARLTCRSEPGTRGGRECRRQLDYLRHPDVGGCQAAVYEPPRLTAASNNNQLVVSKPVRATIGLDH